MAVSKEFKTTEVISRHNFKGSHSLSELKWILKKTIIALSQRAGNVLSHLMKSLLSFQSDYDTTLHKFFHDVLDMKEPKYEYNFATPYVEPWDDEWTNPG